MGCHLDVRGFFGLVEGVRPGQEDVRVTVTLTGLESDETYARLTEQVDAHGPVLDIFPPPADPRTRQTPATPTTESAVDIALVVEELEARLQAAADPDRAAAEQAYFKSDLTHLGVSVPATRRVVKATLRDHGPLGRDDLVAVVDALWATSVHECRLAAVEVLAASPTLLSVAEAAWLEDRLRACATWALLDPLVIGVVGVLVERDAPGWDPVVRRWAADADHWVRRAALLAHLPALRRGEGDWDRFTEFADRMLGEREFFVRKAIGWVLRETAKQRPQLVADWLEPRAHRAAGLTVREAVKPLPADDRARVLAARASG